MVLLCVQGERLGEPLLYVFFRLFGRKEIEECFEDGDIRLKTQKVFS